MIIALNICHHPLLPTLTGDLSTSGIQANGFFRTMSQPKEHKFPYMQSFFWTSLMGNNQAISERMRTSFGVDKEVKYNFNYYCMILLLL